MNMEAGFTPAHLPIVREYADRMGLVEIINEVLAGGMHVSPGKIVLGLVMNLLFTVWRSSSAPGMWRSFLAVR
jgi:hypothetical protein